MGEAGKDALQVGCTSWTFGGDRTIVLAFHGARVNSDAGLFPYRDLDAPRFFRADAAFAIYVLYGLLEAEGYPYAIRLKANAVTERHIASRCTSGFRLAEVVIPRGLYRAILRRIRRFAAICPRAAPIGPAGTTGNMTIASGPARWLLTASPQTGRSVTLIVVLTPEGAFQAVADAKKLGFLGM